ncbi:MAG: hypothetical protein EA381_13270 [Planctomycetaceae bacterium]|nr:MAG: hypothetical protein EA381_13270 [Planctomycetaceae bacterium]
MIKRVNSTGRRRIGKDHVQIELHEGPPRRFDAEVQVSGFDNHPEAAVVLEATCAGSNQVCRFEWGSVGNLRPTENRLMPGLDGANVYFTLKVIDRSEDFGRILGLADNIRPVKAETKAGSGRRGILPVEPAELGDELWRLEYRTEDVFLLVNQRVDGLVDRIRYDSAIYPLIYPTIVRDVLHQALEAQLDDDDDADRWPALWLRFAQDLHPERTKPPAAEGEDERREWVSEVVKSFCRDHALRERFVRVAGDKRSWEESP